MEQPLAHFTFFVASMDATVTDTFPLRRISTIPIASNSSDPSEMATRALGMVDEN